MYLQGVFLDFLFYIYFLLFPAKLIYRAAKDPLSGDISSKQKPVLFVVQHTTMAVDLFALMGFIYLNYGRLPRGLGDRSTSNGRLHFKVPIWSHMLTFFGAIVGDRQGCAELMKQGEPILVFPGGRKEVFRSKSDHGSYSLHWQDRKGFARMAIDHEYDIIPISSIGAEHCTSVLIDIPVPTIITSFIGEKSFNIPLVVPNLWTVSTWPRFHLTAGERISSMEFTTGDGENLDLQSGLLRDRVKQIILVQQRESLQAISDASTITNGKNE